MLDINNLKAGTWYWIHTKKYGVIPAKYSPYNGSGIMAGLVQKNKYGPAAFVHFADWGKDEPGHLTYTEVIREVEAPPPAPIEDGWYWTRYGEDKPVVRQYKDGDWYYAGSQDKIPEHTSSAIKVLNKIEGPRDDSDGNVPG